MEGIATHIEHTIYHKRCHFKLSCSFFGPFHSELDFGDESWEGLLDSLSYVLKTLRYLTHNTGSAHSIMCICSMHWFLVLTRFFSKCGMCPVLLSGSHNACTRVLLWARGKLSHLQGAYQAVSMSWYMQSEDTLYSSWSGQNTQVVVLLQEQVIL